MKSSQRKSNLSYKDNQSYLRELKYLQKWFDELLIIFHRLKGPYPPKVLKQNMAIVIEVLMYNLLYLTPHTRHQLMGFLARPDFTNLFPKESFPSLVIAIDLQMQRQPLSVSQTATWERFSENLRISTVKVFAVILVDRYNNPEVTQGFNQTIGRLGVCPIQEFKVRTKCRTGNGLSKYFKDPALQTFVPSAEQKEIFKNNCLIAETYDPKEFRKVFQFNPSKIRLPSKEKSWLTPLKNWWHRDSIMLSDLIIRVTMLCGLAENLLILSWRRQALLQKFLSQIRAEIKAKISAEKNKGFFRKLGSNNNLELRLKNLIKCLPKIENLQLGSQPQQPTKKEGEQGDSHGTMTSCREDLDSDSDSDLDLEDEPSAKPITDETLTTGSPPRFLPVILLAQQLLPALLPKEEKTAAVEPQQGTQPDQAIAVNTPLKKSAQPQPTKSDHTNKESKANQNHIVQTQLVVRQVKQPVPNKGLEPVPVPNQPQFLRKKHHHRPKPKVAPNTKPTPPRVKPVAAPANAKVSKNPPRAELTALKAMNIYELRRIAEEREERQRMNNTRPTVFQAEAGSLLVHL